MKNFLKILILPIAIITVVGGFAPRALAQPVPLSVQFVPDPLFVQTSFLPLDETSGTVTVTNNSGEAQNIITEAINVFDNDNFGNLLHLTIEGSSETFFDGALANFFSTAGELPLGTISAGESKAFTYTISFGDSSDNSYQGKALGFDVCVGFEGGNTHCGTTDVGGEQSTGGGTTGATPSGGAISGSGGGGGGGGGAVLSIYNERVLNVDNGTGVALIEWDTNLYSTSQVIYGPVSGSYTLVLIPPDFGYPSYTTEDQTKVLHHSVLLSGLTPSETYVYRVISRASPPTVSIERTFTLLATSLQSGSGVVGDEVVGATGWVAGNETGAGTSAGNTFAMRGGTGTDAGIVAGTPTEENTIEGLPLQLAAALYGLPPGLIEFLQSFGVPFLFLLLTAFIIWLAWRYYKNRSRGND